MMVKPFIVKDIVPATAKEISALADGELGIYLIDGADNAWKPAGSVATGTHAGFAIGQGTGKNALLSPVIQKNLAFYNVKSNAYLAEASATATVVATVSGYTADASDYIQINLKGFSVENNDFGTGSETYTVVGKATGALIHTEIAALINAKSSRYTAVTTGSLGVTNVVITAKEMASFSVSYVWGRSPLVTATTTAPVLTTTMVEPIFGIGTPRIITTEIEEADWMFGRVGTREKYEGKVPTQSVAGTKYSSVVFKYRENKATTPVRDTHYQENTLVFYCDVTAGSPTTLVADLDAWIAAFFVQ